MAISKSKLISSVIVTGLFGKYDYEIPQKRATDPSLNRTIFIYGDNGCGKTTVLRLVFHALATAEKAGHRTFLSRTKFRTLEITLDNGTKVSCAKTGNDLLGTFKMSVKKKNKRPVEYEFEADEGYTIPVNPTEQRQLYL